MVPFLAAIPGVSWLANNKLARDIAIGLGALLLAVIGYKTWKWNVERGVKRQMRDQFDRERAEQIASQTKEAMERVEAFNDGRDSVLRLPDDELRERTETDPNNRGLVPRD